MTIKVFFDFQPTRACPFVAYAWVKDNKVEDCSSLSFERAEADLLAKIRNMNWNGEVPEPKEVEV